ncbi:ABC transporter ATP-binding protein [Cutibacterium porci]|nr:ABC transporter ATP-binding protein [Cutibacterium porci]
MIAVSHLTKKYGRFTAVNDVSFNVAAGSVTGFLGPNGAGKSTTLKCIVGLARPTSGAATVLGQPFAALPNPASQIGVLLDASAMHPGRTGRETLTIAATVIGAPQTGVDKVLDLVGLTQDEARRRVGAYSLGMRQRLGIAVALLGNPRVLILDEPANGLDPQGIHWIRTLLRDYADRGGAVLLSSHLLHEVQLIADRVVMIGSGRIVADDTLANLTAHHENLEDTFFELTTPASRIPQDSRQRGQEA